MNTPNWFYVYDSTNDQWLQDDRREFGPYSGAAEFEPFEDAESFAREQIAKKGRDYNGTLIVLADHGMVEL